MSRYLRLTWGVLFLFFLFACQKELSFEQGQKSKGSLQSASGDCNPKTVGGTFKASQALGDTNFIEVTVNVTQTGTYTIYTDTLNGYYFRATGTFSNTGSATVRLKGFGTPGAAGIDDFSVIYDSSICNVAVTVLPGGSSGGSSSFTLSGSGSNCLNSNVQGTYTQATALTTANKVTIEVNVTTVGTWSLSTATVTGFSFSGSGTFTTTGVQTITLNGTGTPTAAGQQTFTLTAGSSTCTFNVTVVPNSNPPAVFTLAGAPGACGGFTPSGTYTQGVALTTGNTVAVQVNVTTPGLWTVTTNTVAGMTFSGTGVFAAAGTQTITLNGSGTPSASGAQTFTVTAGSSNCTFSITVGGTPPPPSNDYFPRTANSNWSYEIDNDPDDTILRKVISPTHSALSNTYNIFMATDDASFGFDSSGYYRRSGGDYYEFIDAAGDLGFENEQWVEYIFLKDNVPVTTVWYSPTINGVIGGTNFQVRNKFTILQKDVTVVVRGVSYQNTIVVEQKVEQNTAVGWIENPSAGVLKSYYARGIGLIKQEFTDPTGTLLIELTRSQVY